MGPLNQDTLADKALRFVIGAVLGGAVAWGMALEDWVTEGKEFARLLVIAAGIGGALAVVGGNKLIERALRDRWWE